MKWYRMYTEARTDAKLRLLTDAEHRVWFNLLCLSCEEEPRGQVNGIGRVKLAAEVARGREDLLSRTVEKLSRLEIIEVSDGGLAFLHFAERQYETNRPPSQLPAAATERKRRSRGRHK